MALTACGASLARAQHRIPAIDPTGQRLFSGSTTLAIHDLFHHKRNEPTAAPVAPVAIAPFAVAPVAPPPCTPPIEAVPVVPVIPQPVVVAPPPAVPAAGNLNCPTGPASYRGPEIMVTPARIVAPVNTEVVMAAGLCSPDGYYVTKQPLEWMLAQDGVGQIVSIGHESRHDTSFLLRNSPQKVATNYARAHTSTISQTINRGTPSPADDVYLHKGQSWISITSPTEGTSHVVVWAPKEANWERRKATATIYWVDAAWRFPQSVAARAGRPQPLTTVLTRSGGEPLSGWLVRYEVLDGPPATFVRGSTSIEVRTDGAGRATAEVVPASPEQGITTVGIQVIRPSAARGELPQMVVGQGVVGVQWTTPGLAVRALGSSNVASDGAVGYRVEVTNGGDLTTHNVALSFTPPTGVTVLNSSPSAQVFGQRFEWRLGDLPAGTTRIVELNCRATVPGSIRSTFTATSTEVPKAEGRVTTDVTVNSLSVRMTGPESVEVGREAKFLIDVTNNGSTRLTNVTARDIFDNGLSHAGGEQSPLVRALSAPLEPGQTDHFAISFVVTQPGRQCHRLDVSADGGHSAGARACVTGIAPMVTAPQLSVRVAGPPARQQNEVAQFQVEVKNNGGSPATNVELAVTWGVNLALIEATGGREDDAARFTTRWRIMQISPGETITRQLNCRALQPDDQGAMVRATVRSQQTAAVTNQTTTMILPAATVPPARTTPPASPPPVRPESTPPASAPPPVAGNLRINASALANPIMAGGTTSFLINITNDRAAADQDVALSVQVIGDGLAIRIAGTTPTPTSGVSPTAIDFAPIREMRPGESPTYRLEVRGASPGRHRIRVTATSALARTPVSTETEIVVNAP